MESQEIAATYFGKAGRGSGSSGKNSSGKNHRSFRVIYSFGLLVVLVVLVYAFFPIFFSDGTKTSYFLHKGIPTAKITSASGESLSFEELISQQKASMILVNFFATWCEPCLRELPLLNRAKDIALKKDRDILLINYDGGMPEKTRNQVAAWSISENLNFNVFFDFEEALLKQLGVEGLPFSMIIGRQKQQVLWVKTGELREKDIQFFLNEEGF
jgi:thiol-disulfide isomerase/thioredoxin